MNDQILEIADGAEPITLVRPGTTFSVEIPKALIRPLLYRKQRKIVESVIPAKIASWYLPKRLTDESAPTFLSPPQPGDEIHRADGIIHLVIEVHESQCNDLWQLVTKSHDVTFGPDEHVDWLQATYGKSASGVLERGYVAIQTAVAAKFSPVTMELTDAEKPLRESKRASIRKSYYVFIRDKVDLTPLDVLRRADGTLLNISRVQMPVFAHDWIEILVTENTEPEA